MDFEWAGLANETTYPLFMNHKDIQWPPGATDGKPITKEHDEWWLDRLTGAGPSGLQLGT